MRQKYIRCGTRLSEHKAVEIIVNNTNDTHNNILAARVYNSLEHLTAHAEYLMRGKVRKHTNTNRYERKPFVPYKARFDATSECNEMNSEISENDESQNENETASVDETALAQVFAEAIKGYFRPNTNTQRKNFVPRDRSTNSNRESKGRDTKSNEVHPIVCTNCTKWGHNYQSCTEPKTIRCWGCGLEGVMKSECDNCKPKNA